MNAVFINTLSVVAGSLIGLFFKKGLPQRISDTIMQALGLITILIGISGALEGGTMLIIVISLTVGGVIGSALDLDAKFTKFVQKLEKKYKNAENKTDIATGFITSSVLFCVGAMTIVGSLRAGLAGDNELLLTKSALDFVSSIIFAATLGFGVLFSAAAVLVIEGGIVLAAQWLAPVLSDTVITEMTCVGSLVIIAIGLNLLKIADIKALNFLPAIFLPILICIFI
jgi:uncharacterized membrane protein YqgA involved in biofilm formation